MGDLELLPNDLPELPRAVKEHEEARKRRFRFLSPSEFREAVKPATPIVDGFIYGRGQYLLFGPWGLGKTFVAMDLALAVAHRFEKWHGRRLYMDRPVVYLAFEGDSWKVQMVKELKHLGFDIDANKAF